SARAGLISCEQSLNTQPGRNNVGRSRRLKALIAAGSIAGILLAPGAAGAQTYPNHPVRLVVGFAPGGNTDLIARIVADKVQGALGQRVIIDNRRGANGAI